MLFDTAPGREADYIMPGLARDTRHESVCVMEDDACCGAAANQEVRAEPADRSALFSLLKDLHYKTLE